MKAPIENAIKPKTTGSQARGPRGGQKKRSVSIYDYEVQTETSENGMFYS